MPEDLKLSQIGSSQLPPPFRGLHSPGVRKHCQIIFACYFLSCCFMSTEAGWPIRDGDRVGRGQGDWLDRGNRPKKTGETVDRRQNNGSVKAVSPRHCPATCAPCNCSFKCCAGQSHKDNVHCTAVDEQLGQLEAKDVQLAQPSSTSLLMISSGQKWGSSSTSLL